MSADERDDRPWPAWALPRHGVRTALRCWAVAALTVAAVAACHGRASGEAVVIRSAELIDSHGRVICRVTRAADGWFGASHCTRPGGRYVVRGHWLPWSTDPTRDLLHLSDAPADVATRAWVAGERLLFANDRAVGHYTAAREWSYTQSEVGYDDAADDAPGARKLLAACYSDGQHARYGDSGSGVLGADDGALIGVVVAATDPHPYAPWNRECGERQTVLIEAVP